MFTTPKKQKQQQNISNMDAKDNNPHLGHLTTNTPNSATMMTITTTAATTTATSTINSGMMVAYDNDTPNSKFQGTSSATYLAVPEIVISSSCSTNSLNRMTSTMANSEDMAVESTALLETSLTSTNSNGGEERLNDNRHPLNDPEELSGSEPHMLADEFEQFILNRTTSDSNILESSIYSELQFPPSLHGGSIISGLASQGGGYVSSSGGPITANSPQVAGPQTPAAPSGRATKRTKRKHKTKTKCTATAAQLAAAAAASQRASPTGHYPPRYTAIFMDQHHSGHHHHHQYGNVMSAHHHSGNAANALGQIASAAASSPFLNAPVAAADAGAAAAAAYMQQFQYFQQRPMVTSMAPLGGGSHRRHHRSLFEATTTTTNAFGLDNPLTVLSNGSTPSVPAGTGISPPLRLSFRKWFSRPSLPFVIGILALGGVACTLGGIVLGSTGLIEHSTQYLSAALLMIGIGVSLLVISGAIWRLSLPDDVEECPCYRHMEMCRNCNSPYCNSRLMAGGFLYPEFQHRPPPPSYLTSLNECAGMSLLFHPTAAAPQTTHYNAVRVNTPPPLYRSTNSLSVFGSNSTTAGNGNALQSTNLVPTLNRPAAGNSVGIVPDHSVITMSTVMENLQAQTQPLIKEFNYLELD
ncbi:uncharacterized protein LOC106081024 [Stomoxys calcitrans]|uniref:uncharacterized protein LOC106081024 n=1 Tax=Stomoxys calcitrans TaxID=35570 RepID=UPI0027E26FB8|nr:uncharacterized protein LOC106081024 [Stomoxys calcitrans]